jgi:hypothetical protein
MSVAWQSLLQIRCLSPAVVPAQSWPRQLKAQQHQRASYGSSRLQRAANFAGGKSGGMNVQIGTACIETGFKGTEGGCCCAENKVKSHRKGGFLLCLVEAAGIEPASASALPSALHA